ncbi:helix-turn-helix transcriptional regulator [Cupriavidus necator]|uniref:helix-turn-helix transcriptional regulator n=1 Tax=Cupriavidus necator TaxID=106590 RepID=UPI003AF3F465
MRLLRLSWNLTQAELAARAGVSLRSVKDLERGAATLRSPYCGETTGWPCWR